MIKRITPFGALVKEKFCWAKQCGKVKSSDGIVFLRTPPYSFIGIPSKGQIHYIHHKTCLVSPLKRK
jgi:hypothetical protein